MPIAQGCLEESPTEHMCVWGSHRAGLAALVWSYGNAGLDLSTCGAPGCGGELTLGDSSLFCEMPCRLHCIRAVQLHMNKPETAPLAPHGRMALLPAR